MTSAFNKYTSYHNSHDCKKKTCRIKTTINTNAEDKDQYTIDSKHKESAKTVLITKSNIGGNCIDPNRIDVSLCKSCTRLMNVLSR